jgi:osmotically-inducible protein OsmY
MQTRSLLLAAGIALATGACQTTPGDTAGDTADSSTGASAAIDPNRSLSTPDETLHDRVHDALMEQMGPKVNDVGVTMHDTTVHLTGHVHSAADKQRAHDIAHGVSGVTAVDISALAVQP